MNALGKVVGELENGKSCKGTYVTAVNTVH